MKKLTKSDLNLSEWDFEFQQRNGNCILLSDFHTRGLYQYFPEDLKFGVFRYDYLFTNSSHGYTKLSQRSPLLQKLREALLNEDYLEYVLRNSVGQMQFFRQKMNSFNKEIQRTHITDTELGELWIRFDAAFIRITPWFYIPWYISEYNMLTDRVKSGLISHKNEVEKIIDLTDALTLLIFPVKKAAFQEEQGYFFELVGIAEKEKDFESNSIFQQKLNTYLDEYSWMKTYFVMPLAPLDKKELIEKIKNALMKGAHRDFTLQQEMHKKNREKAEELLTVLQSDSTLIKDIAWARRLGWVLTAGVDEAMRAGAQFKPLLELVASHLSITTGELQHLTSEEILRALQGKAQINPVELKERGDAFTFALLSGESMIASGDEGRALSEWIENSFSVSKAGIMEFKGQSASRGVAIGKVKIASSPKDSYSLKEGEILVCSMTGPDYVPAMKRAGAIVTVEGGLLSHAAIMSREFGKPCIVGTKVATQVLKDGDLIEVDADKGVVKIIKKANG